MIPPRFPLGLCPHCIIEAHIELLDDLTEEQVAAYGWLVGLVASCGTAIIDDENLERAMSVTCSRKRWRDSIRPRLAHLIRFERGLVWPKVFEALPRVRQHRRTVQ